MPPASGSEDGVLRVTFRGRQLCWERCGCNEDALSTPLSLARSKGSQPVVCIGEGLSQG